jgi:hypothetical protein
LIQCVVKPREVVSVYGRCHIQLSSEERDAIDTQEIKEDVDDELPQENVRGFVDVPPTAHTAPVQPPAQPISTLVEDSDGEDNVTPPAPPVEQPKPVKKVVKSETPAATPVPVPVPAPAPAQVEESEVPVASDTAPAAAAPVKKVVKKVVKK